MDPTTTRWALLLAGGLLVVIGGMMHPNLFTGDFARIAREGFGSAKTSVCLMGFVLLLGAAVV